MFNVRVSQDAWDYSVRLVGVCNFGRRVVASGTREQQLVGLIGQTVVHDLFKVPRPRDLGGSDGGVDLELGGAKIDVKTVGRGHNPLPEYANNVMRLQEDGLADVLLFCSLNKKTQVLTVCGWLPKAEVPRRGKLHAAGTHRKRSDGTEFTLRADIYEVVNRDLRPAHTVRQVERDLTAFSNAPRLMPDRIAP